MHELSLAQSIVDTVLEVAEKHGAKRVLSARLQVGEVALVNVDQLLWYIDLLVKDTLAEGMSVDVTRVPVEIHCFSCGYKGSVQYREVDPAWHVAVPLFQCVQCHATQTVIISGRELSIKEINVQLEDEEEGAEVRDA
jgi:hydrogenase nickel incorporation protein HypA/HybF